MDAPHQVVIIGGGFGGICAARALKRAPLEVTLIDRRNFHLFQPLLYQVATGGLSPANLAAPLRVLLKRQKNAEVRLGEVVDIDVANHRVMLTGGGEIGYDTLVVAAGSAPHYFGHDDWKQAAPTFTRARRRLPAVSRECPAQGDWSMRLLCPTGL